MEERRGSEQLTSECHGEGDERIAVNATDFSLVIGFGLSYVLELADSSWMADLPADVEYLYVVDIETVQHHERKAIPPNEGWHAFVTHR